MTVQTVPYALQNAAHSAALFRQSASAPFTSGGILAAGELTVTQQATPNMSVILGAGRAKVAGTSVSPPSGLSFTTQGMYDVLNDAPLTLTVATADATNPRIDVPYLQVQDSFYSGAANQAIAGIVTGTPAPTPVTPPVPSNAIGLANIAVAANATSIINANISNTAIGAALNGGSLKIATLALLQTVSGVLGQLAVVTTDTTNNGVYECTGGTTWVPLQPTVTRDFITYGPVASSTTLKTVALPAVPYASVVEIRFDGLLADGTGVAHAARVVFTASAGTLQSARSQPDYVPANQVVTHVVAAVLTIPANTAVTLTAASAAASATTYYEGLIRTSRTAS